MLLKIMIIVVLITFVCGPLGCLCRALKSDNTPDAVANCIIAALSTWVYVSVWPLLSEHL